MPSAYTVDMCIYINIFDIWITQPNTLDWTDEKKNNNHATATAHPNPLACDSLFFCQCFNQSVVILVSILWCYAKYGSILFYFLCLLFTFFLPLKRHTISQHFSMTGVFFVSVFYNFGYSIHRCSFHPLLFTFVCSHNNNEQLLLAVIWFWVYISHSSFLYLSIIYYKEKRCIHTYMTFLR